MKVLLVATNRMTSPFPVYPLGVDYVATALQGRHEVRVQDLGGSADNSVLVDVLRGFEPEIVGLSIRNVDNAQADNPRSFLDDLEAVINTVREHSAAKVVLGGAGFSIFPGVLMDHLGADYGIVGEGERVLDLLAAIEEHRSPDGLPGVIIGEGPVRRPAPWEGSCYREITSESTIAHYLKWGGMLNVQTKRGCPFSCTYCTYPVIEGRRIRRFEPERVAEEWGKLAEAGAKYIFVTDSVFNSDHGHSLRVARAVKRAGLTVPWGAFFAPMKPPAGYYEELREAGLSHVEFGTEALSHAMLRAYRKPFTPEHAIEAHEAARAANLHIAHYIMLGGPGETMSTARETLDRCESLDRAALFFFCGVRVYPSTPLYELASREGQVDRSAPLLRPAFYQSPDAPPEAITALVRERSAGRLHWVLGSGDAKMEAIMRRMHQRGMVGPLWERMIP